MDRILFTNFLRERNDERQTKLDKARFVLLDYTAKYEPITPVCRHFGCGKTLSLHEQLCGGRCVDHVTHGQSVGKSKNNNLEGTLNKIIVSKLKLNPCKQSS